MKELNSKEVNEIILELSKTREEKDLIIFKNKEIFDQVKELDYSIQIKTNLLKSLGEFYPVIYHGYEYKNITVNTNKFDQTLFKQESPEIYNQFMKSGSYTKLTIKQIASDGK